MFFLLVFQLLFIISIIEYKLNEMNEKNIINMVLSKCATYNTHPLCFLRLYLPVLDTIINRETENISLSDIPEKTKDNKEIYEIQSHNQLLDLFNNDVNASFIGIITIKFILFTIYFNSFFI